jgi:hypothetical protein
MNSTREEVVNAILDKLFVNGMGQRADRMVLVQEDYSGKAKVSDAHDLGGWSRLPIRDLLLDALRQREQEVRESCAKIADAVQRRELNYRANEYEHEIAYAYKDISQAIAEEIATAIREDSNG